MNIHVTYLTDSEGQRQAVQIAYSDWLRLQHTLEIKETQDSLTQSFAEIEAMEAGRLPKVSMGDFLAEWDATAKADAD